MTPTHPAPRERTRFLRFCAAGVLGLGVDVGVLYLTAPLLGLYAGRIASFLAAATTTWWVNRRTAFPDRAARTPRARWAEYFQYLASMLGGGAINYATYLLVLRAYEGPGRAALGVAAGSVAGLAVNYLAARWLVFRR